MADSKKDQSARDLKTLRDAETIKRDKNRLTAVMERVRAEQKRTGAQLIGRPAPRRIQGSLKESLSKGSQAASSKKRGVADFLSGKTTRSRIKEAEKKSSL